MLRSLWSDVCSFFSRLDDVFAHPADTQSAARLQAEQFAAVRRNTPVMMAATICNAFVLLATFIDTPLEGRAVVWTNVVLLFSIYIYLRARRRARVRREGPATTSIGRRAIINALILGSLWAAVPVLFFLEAGPGARLMVVSLTAGMLFGGAFALARAPLAATIFAGLITVAAAFTLLRGGDPDLTRIAMVLCVYSAVLLRNVFVEARNFKDRLLTQMGAEREARTDPLTGLPNRLAFTDAMEREVARLRRYGGGFLLLCIDINDFKLVNDRYGHPAGDELLAQAARRMRASLRTSDLVARLGGDEFAIVASDVMSTDAAGILAERIVACFEEPFLLEGRAVKGGASVGGALATLDTIDQRELLKNADVALYQAKQEGGGWRLFQQMNDPGEQQARALEHDLRRALALDQFALVFQPVLKVATREIVGCEALLRWRHPTLGEIMPAIVIPMAERLGLIHEIGLWVIEQSLAAAARLPEDMRISFNVSALQLCREDFAERVREAVAEAQVAPRRIDIEITEKALIASHEVSDAQALKLARAGLGLSLDDFGVGYASLNYLCKLPLSRVKIDGAFMRCSSTHAHCAAIISGLIRMARDIGVEVVAEGVEELSQLEWLEKAGCGEAQGYLIARPMPLDELEAFLVDWRPDRLVPPPLQERRA